jgi:predicted short-subunit dehydrogenase-like oxidoreductase (DUF2520 family)
MRAWDDSEEIARGLAEARERERRETADELAAQGIDLDPRAHRERNGEAGDEGHGDDTHGDGDPAQEHDHGDGLRHAHDHAHPHAHSGPADRPQIGIVGAGPVGTALGIAFSRAGWPVAAVASRDAARRERFRQLVPGVRAFAEANAVVDDVELVFLTVPDDVVPRLAHELRLYSGQAMVHTSGLLGAEVLDPAMAAGTQAGGFHPLVAFADVDRALEALPGATIAIEGDDQLAAMLADLATAIGGTPVRLAPGSKPAYHAAAVLAAGGVTALLDAIREVAAVVGLDEAGAMAIYLPLLEQTVGNARALGIAASLTGPAVRGDAGTVAAHRAALAADAPGATAIYEALLERMIEVSERRGAVTPEGAEHLRSVLATRS